MTTHDSIAFTQDLADVRGELERIAASDCVPINLDVRAAVFTARGVVPKVVPLRAEIARWLGEEQAAYVDHLDQAARAAGAAYAQHASLGNPAELEPISVEVAAVRETLLLRAESLVARGVVDGEKLGGLRGAAGYKNQYLDVLQLVAVFRSDWSRIEPHTSVTAADLDRAEGLANELSAAVGRVEQDQPASSPTALLRDRAWTHFVRTYDEVRRAVVWLRDAEEDADQIAPSLWAGRGGRASDDAVVPLPVAPTGTPIRPGMPGSPPFAT